VSSGQILLNNIKITPTIIMVVLELMYIIHQNLEFNKRYPELACIMITSTITIC
jgi:hypothetical protein